MRLVGILVAALLTGCVGIGLPPPDAEPVPVGPLNAPFPRPDGDGPPIECRGLARDRCEAPGSIADGVGGVALDEVERVIVSCIGSCSSNGGEFRIDVVIGDQTREVGRGAYGTTP